MVKTMNDFSPDYGVFLKLHGVQKIHFFELDILNLIFINAEFASTTCHMAGHNGISLLETSNKKFIDSSIFDNTIRTATFDFDRNVLLELCNFLPFNKDNLIESFDRSLDSQVKVEFPGVIHLNNIVIKASLSDKKIQSSLTAEEFLPLIIESIKLLN
jgi:hypothetical protein